MYQDEGRAHDYDYVPDSNFVQSMCDRMGHSDHHGVAMSYSGFHCTGVSVGARLEL